MDRVLPLLIVLFSVFTLSAQQNLDDIAHIEEDGRWVSLDADVFEEPKSFLENHKQDLAMSLHDDFELVKEEEDKLGHTHHKFNQVTNGVVVEGALYIVHTQDDRLLRANGRLVPHIKAPSEALISSEEAIASAILYTDADQYYWQDAQKEATLKRIMKDETATFYPQAELVYADREYSQNGSQYHLAWKMEIHANGPKGEKILFIDALDGHILYELEGCQHVGVEGQAETRYHGLQTFMTDSIAPGVYRLHDESRGVSIETYNMATLPADSVPQAGIDFFDDDNYWDTHNEEADDAATDVHWGIQHTYDYFLSQGRNSYDGAGSPIISYVHVRQSWFNARWTGRWMEYGDGSGNPLTSIDVVAHELTHGVTGTSSGLVYRNESGALNESFSDIFGTMVEFIATPDSFDWFLGKLDFQFRSLSDPNDMGDPDTYLGQFWEAGTADNGGVHTNSGVQNHWFYLLSVGGSGTNDNGDDYEVEGIGIDTAAAIAFRNLTTYLTVSSTYADARYGAVLSAEDLYGPCSEAVQQTISAWYAVGVGPDMVINDMEIQSPEAPLTNSCDFSETEDVTISMLYRRSGCRIGIPVGTRLPVSYTINNGSPVLDTITLANEVLDGEVITHTFSIPADLSNPAYYDFDFYASFPGDANSDNNEIKKFTVVSVETQFADKLIHFNEFVRPSVPPYFTVENERSTATTAREAAASGLRGFLMTGKNIQQGHIDPATNEEENFSKNQDYESRLCMCVNAIGWDSVSIEFDLRQGVSDVYREFLDNTVAQNGIALRLIADEMPVSQQFHPDTIRNDTIDIDTFVHQRINLDQLAGTSFNLCFQGKHFFDKSTDFFDTDGDYSHIDNIDLQMRMLVGTRDRLLDANLVSAFPNPTSDQLYVQWSEATVSPTSIKLMDLSGRVLDVILKPTNETVSIDVTTYASGIYFLHVESDEGALVKKIVIQ